MPLYPVQTPVKSGGTIHAEGSIELSAEDAAPLLASGAVGPALPELDHDSRQARIRAVMEEMLASDPEQIDQAKWTQGGVPHLGYLNQLLKDIGLARIDSTERDAIWAALSSNPE